MLADKNACTGCNVCQNVCGKNCIAMKYDEEGFWHPVIDSDLCVHCGLCEKVCPVLHKNEEDNFKNPETYAVQDKTAANLQISSSGGIFGVIAEYIIGQGGIVYGAVYGKHSKVVYGRADNTEILKKIRGTKYVQADVKMAFKEAGHDLKSGKMVLFSGTPCIIAALYNYVRTLQIDESKLFTVDLICHGVPSPLFFDRFIAELEKENEKEILEFIFRPKNLEWGQVSALGRPSIKFLDKTQSSISKNDKEYYYYYGFLKNLFLRRSCHQCQFVGLPRVADFTIGDFWGIEQDNELPFEKKMGVSCLMLNNEKAKTIFNNISSFVFYKEEKIELVKKYNTNMILSVRDDSLRKRFYKYYNAHTWEESKKFILKIKRQQELKNRIKDFGYEILGVRGRMVVKKIIRR